MKRLFSLFTSIVMALLLIQMVYSDELPVSANLRFYGTYIDNVFQTALPESDYVTLTYLDLSYDVISAASIFYNANLNLFSEHSDLRSHTHYLGIDYEREVSQGRGLLYLGGKLGLRQNTPEYDPYDRRSGNAHTTLKYYLTESILGKMGYRMEYGSYPNYQTSSFLENYGFLQLSKFFESRTTLQVEVDAGRRDYPNLNGDNGRDYAAQMTGAVKIAQSLADHTGLQLQYVWHRAPKNIKDDQCTTVPHFLPELAHDTGRGFRFMRFYKQQTRPWTDLINPYEIDVYGKLPSYGYYSVEDFLEDEYNYSSHKYQITLKHLGPWRTMVKGTISRENREYNTLSIHTTDGRRKDSDVTFFFEVEKKFSLPLGSSPDFALHIEFLHRKNHSNDPYYDYSANVFSIGTKAAF